ncbi:MAG: DUF3899 domain-containing protein [Firmicutes bacterium]|nr:DUF3899 domain-containing protein [Bacillota bacterium]
MSERDKRDDDTENAGREVNAKGDIRKRIVANLITGLIVSAALFAYETASEDFSYTIIHRLCDASFVAAVLLMGIGGLKFCRNGGTFDIMSFGIKTVVDVTYPWLFHHPRENHGEKLADYKERKRGERRGASDLLISGAVFLAAAIVFLIIWMATEG